MKIEKYKLKNGETRYKFQTYLGLNPLSNKYVYKQRRGFKTYAEAVKEYSKIKNKFHNRPQTRRVLFNDVYEEWFNQKTYSIKSSTLYSIQLRFKNHILPYFGKMYMDKIQVKELQEFTNLKFKEIKGYKRLIQYISSLFKFAINKGYLDYNPCQNIIYPEDLNKKYNFEEKEENFLNTDELVIFLKECKEVLDDMWYLYFYLLAFTGMRKGEGLGLDWENIKNINGKYIIQIRQTITRGLNGMIVDYPKTKESIRDIEITKDLYDLLMNWKEKQRDIFGNLKMVFNNTKCNYVTQSLPAKKLNKVYENLDIKKITIHGLRHTFASICFEAGMQVKEVQGILGHSDYQITLNLYTHLTKKRKEESINKFNNYIQKHL